METEKDTIQLAGARLQGPCHVCAFFHSRDEEARVLLPFIKEGIQRGERVFQIIDPGLRLVAAPVVELGLVDRDDR